MVEAALLLCGAAAAFLVFGAGREIRLERGYLLLPVLGWAALRFGLRGASLLGAGLAFLSALATSHGVRAAGSGCPNASARVPWKRMRTGSVPPALYEAVST